MGQVTIKDIARICGVGVTTVSRAINNHPDINEETRKKVMDAVKEHHYVPNNSARNLKRVESRTIAVLVKGISNPFFGPVIKVLEREILRKKYTFILQQVEEKEDEVEAALQLEKEKRLKGIVFLGGMSSPSEKHLKALAVPFVIATVDTDLPETVSGFGVVSIEDERESYRMVRYLCGLGHKRIAILTAAEADAGIGCSRLRGYKRALEDSGLAFDPELVIRMEADLQTYTIGYGYELTSRLLRERRDFTCLYAISDTLAIGAVRAATDAGLQVPEDLSVAGFDGIEFGRYYIPSVTTVEQPREEMAMAAVKLLFDLIKGKETHRKITFEGQLKKRESTRRIV